MIAPFTFPEKNIDYKNRFSAPSSPNSSAPAPAAQPEGPDHITRQGSDEAQTPTSGIGNGLLEYARNRDQAKAAADFAGIFS